MKVLGQRVLVEETMTKKTSKIIRLDKDNTETFEATYKVLALGTKCGKECEVKIGDIPIFGAYIQLEPKKAIEVTDNRIVSHVIVHIDDIIGIDD